MTRRQKLPKCTKRMKQWASAPRGVLDALDPAVGSRSLETIASMLQVTPAELLLYHEGTAQDPGYAAVGRTDEERRISRRLGCPNNDPFRFPSWAEYRWFMWQSDILPRLCGLPYTQERWFGENWLRGYMLCSFQDYIAEVAAALAKTAGRRRESDREWRKFHVNSHLAPIRTLPPRSDHWMGPLKFLARILTHREPSERTMARWLARGKELQKRPGWHLDTLIVTGDQPSANASLADALQGASLRTPVREGSHGYLESWTRRSPSTGATYKIEYWIRAHSWCGTVSEAQVQRAERSVWKALEEIGSGITTITRSESAPSSLGLGPFGSIDKAKAARTRLRRRGWSVGEIRERGRPFENRGHFILLDAAKRNTTMDNWIEENLAPLDAAVKGLIGRSGELGVVATGPFTTLRIGPYFTEEECALEARRLRRRGLRECTVEPGTRSAELQFHAPASREQFRPLHRQD